MPEDNDIEINLLYSPPDSKWTVKWDDELFIGFSAFDVLALIGERSYVPMDHKKPKRGIAYRLFIQYRIVIDDNMGDEEFLARLAEFGIIELTVTGTRPADYLSEAVDFIQGWHGNGQN